MLTVTQSQDITRLFVHLVKDMQDLQKNGNLGVFEQYNLIVPAASVKTWIMNELAESQGISAMVYAKFWGSFQWQLLENVLDGERLYTDEIAQLPKALANYYQKHYRLVPKNPSLSISFMQWRIFGFLKEQFLVIKNLSERKQHEHVLYDFFENDLAQILIDKPTKGFNQNKNNQHARWWQLAQKIAQVFSGYLTHRLHWLEGWSSTPVQAVPVQELIDKKDNYNRHNGQSQTPEWLVARYKKVNAWQQYIWTHLFVDDFNYRHNLLAWFWQKLDEPKYLARLPKQITFFTLPPVPREDLNFIRRLATHTNIHFLHYNPSMEYWGDIADPFWLGQQQLLNHEAAKAWDSGHFLLARMGKQARDTFKLIGDIAGGIYTEKEQIKWHDDFVETQPENLLQQIQQDILWLDESGAKHNQKQWREADNSIRINACHSFTRQLEVLREDLVVWLNEKDVITDEHGVSHQVSRQPSDIIVMLPDLATNEATIRSVFPNHKGIDDFLLPAKLTGLVESETQTLWQALASRYGFLSSRFSTDTVFSWLMLPPVFTSVNLSHEQMQRGCELLELAGFKRGFDAEHLAKWLNGGDGDDRFTLRYALDRLVMGLLMPEGGIFHANNETNNNHDAVAILPLDTVTLEDAVIIQGLVQIYDDLAICHQRLNQQHTVVQWLEMVIQPDLETLFGDYRGQLSWQEINSAFMNLTQATLNQSSYQTNIHGTNYQNNDDKNHNDNQTNDSQDLNLCSIDFVIGILSEMLATDMRGSEPTGAVTFCRMGTVRPIPYKLVVLLNMNIGEYPVREQPNHFNLMQAGMAEVGDRQREEDETGAFLDALMMAKQACWFYYNGFSTSDIHTHLPANPLQELMMFLDNIHNISADEKPQNTELAEQDKTLTANIPQFIAHPALPFNEDSFSINFSRGKARRRQGFWYDIYQRIYQKNNISISENTVQSVGFIDWSQNIDFPSYHKLFAEADTTFVNGNRFLNDLAKPNMHFLSTQQIQLLNEEEAVDTLEPLTLDKLTEYNLRKILLDSFIQSHHVDDNAQDDAFNAQLYDNNLPAGVVKSAYFEKSQRFVQSQIQVLHTYADQGYTHTQDTLVIIEKHHITTVLPKDLEVSMWANISPTNSSDGHVLKQYIAHLLWQVARKTSFEQVANKDGVSLCVYKSEVKQMQPIPAEIAKDELKKWLAVWQQNTQLPLVLPPKWGVTFAKQLQKDKPLREVKLTDWLEGGFNLGYIVDSCSKHLSWQLILQGADAKELLLNHANIFVDELYTPFINCTEYHKKQPKGCF